MSKHLYCNTEHDLSCLFQRDTLPVLDDILLPLIVNHFAQMRLTNEHNVMLKNGGQKDVVSGKGDEGEEEEERRRKI